MLEKEKKMLEKNKAKRERKQAKMADDAKAKADLMLVERGSAVADPPTCACPISAIVGPHWTRGFQRKDDEEEQQEAQQKSDHSSLPPQLHPPTHASVHAKD